MLQQQTLNNSIFIGLKSQVLKRMYPLVFAVLLIVACKSKKEEPRQQNAGPQAVIVDVIIAGKNSISNKIEVNGSVIANEAANLQPEVSGRLTYLNLPEGTRVTQGTVLARINDADLQANMQKMQEELAKAEVRGEAGAGLVAVTMSGRHDVKRVHIDASLMTEDKEMLEDLIAAAINDAVRRVEETSKAKMSGVAGGMQLPPGFKMPF